MSDKDREIYNKISEVTLYYCHYLRKATIRNKEAADSMHDISSKPKEEYLDLFYLKYGTLDLWQAYCEYEQLFLKE